MKIEIRENKLYLIDAPDSLGSDFIYKYPYKYIHPFLGRQITELIDKIPFYLNKKKEWEFPTVQWIYPVMRIISKKGLTIENPEILSQFSNPGGLLKNPYHLWDNQIDCLNGITSKSHGIAILRTGAGKTTMISVLAKNMLDQGLKTLVMAPTNGVLHEIRDRFSGDFNIDCNYYFDDTKNIHFVNPRGMFRSNKFWLHDPYWQDVDCIIMDEVESCMNDMFLKVLERIPRPKYMYGFSGTANKVTGGKLDFNTGATHTDNELDLISYLGWTSWFEKPKDRTLNIKRIRPQFDFGEITKEMKADPFNKIPIKIAGDPKYHSLIGELFNKKIVKNLFIPFVSRVAINEFLKLTDKKVGLITGSGCQVALTPQTDPVKCTLPELKEYAKNEELDIIIGSRSAFAGIDFPPNWDSSLANPIGNLANSSVQAAGRVSRAEEFNLIWFTCKGNVPVFNPQVRNTVKLMKNYYSQSVVNETEIQLKY